LKPQAFLGQTSSGEKSLEFSAGILEGPKDMFDGSNEKDIPVAKGLN